ncbi:MAG: hypothetical protein K1X64_23720 [Myxococcaceae bacterium]|nr:hypothetical protein [Myxococcaceae bacterium]
MLLALTLAVATAADAGPSAEIDLPVLLARIAQQLPPATLPCGFTEHTTAEELDRHGQPSARERHTFRIERTHDAVERRRISVDNTFHQLSARIRPKEDSELTEEEKERRKRSFRTPFRADEQPSYHFRLGPSNPAGQVVVYFTPVEKDVTRPEGFATVDLDTGRLRTIVSKPSKFPAFLSELDIRMAFGSTACGWQPTRIELKGEGGFLFIRTRFRSTTTLDEYVARE